VEERLKFLMDPEVSEDEEIEEEDHLKKSVMLLSRKIKVLRRVL